MSLEEWWYAVCSYEAPSEEQLSIILGETIQLIDDSDSEWWYAMCPRTEQSGYIPALFIESTEARIARINTIKNSQLTAPLQGDREPRKLSTSSMQRRKSASRQVQFKPTVAYDDGSSGPTERSATQTIIRKLAKMTKRHPRVKDESTRDVRAELGVLRIYADIWNLVTTYKSVKVTRDTTAAEALQMAMERFNPNDDGMTPYALYLVSESSEKRLSPFEYPIDEIEALPEKEQGTARYFLKKLVPLKDAFPVRIYKDDTTFKSIMVDKTTKVEEALAAAAQKFRTDSLDMFYLREHRNGVDTPLEPTALLHTLLVRGKDGDTGTGTGSQRIYLVRRTSDEDEDVDNNGARTLLRIYSYALDMDVAYRTVAISPTMTAAEVVPLALKSFGSLDPPTAYSLSLVENGKADRNLADKDEPFAIVQKVEESAAETGGASAKLYLRKRMDPSATTNPLNPASSRLLMSRMPMRVYCEVATKGKNGEEYSTVLVSDTSTAASVLFSAVEKFDLPRNESYVLFMYCDEKGPRLLADSDNPLIVRNELLQADLTGIRCVLRKNIDGANQSKIPIRVYGDRNWTDKGYKTFVVERTNLVKDVTAQALRRFELEHSPKLEEYSLCPLVNNVSGLALPPTDTISMHLETAQFTLRRLVSMGTTPYLAPQHMSSNSSLDSSDDRGGAEFYPAVHEQSPTSSRPLSLLSLDGSGELVDDDDNVTSTLDVSELSSLAASNRILNDPSLASNPQKQLRINAMTIQQGSNTVPAGAGGPLNLTSASMASHFGDGYSSMSRKSVPPNVAAMLQKMTEATL